MGRGGSKIRVPIAVDQKFGRLTVLAAPHTERRGRQVRTFVACVCDCGASVKAEAYSLRTGKKRSCGCLSVDTSRARMTVHGLSHSRLHNIWMGMIQRCENPDQPSYPRYGGRGIRVCEEWRASFLAFCDWALANGYDSTLSIDRKDFDGPYAPENCRWATEKEQQANRRNNRLVTAFGETQPLEHWLTDPRCAVNRTTVHQRLKKGWAFKSALTTPDERKNTEPVTIRGTTRPFCDWLDDPGLPVCKRTVYQRLKRGMPPELALSLPTQKNLPRDQKVKT